jgi:hypothetical protein
VRVPGSGRQYEIGLAISGGGIRSSTFALGVLQGLAKSGVLAEIDYISAVSGGGYISSWLTKLIHKHGFQNASKQLFSDSPELRWLRRSVSYLRSPSSRHATGSTLFVATYFHNLFASLLSLIAIMTALLLAPRIVLSIVKGILEYNLLIRLASIIGQILAFIALTTVVLRLARPERDLLRQVGIDISAFSAVLTFCLITFYSKQLHSDALLSFLISVPFAIGLYILWNHRNTTPNFKGRTELKWLAVCGIFISSIWYYDLSKQFIEPFNSRPVSTSKCKELCVVFHEVEVWQEEFRGTFPSQRFSRS